MKVVILAGGKGTRLSEYTNKIPKPMVKIKGKPILHHIIEIYGIFGFNDFLIATGYKSDLIKSYFKKNRAFKNFSIKCVNTGLNTMTGGRVLKLKKHIGNQSFFLTYGDGVGNINIKNLLKFHNKNQTILTVTAVRPPARFGYLKIAKSNKVKNFTEKKQTNEGWINGGFFVCSPKIFKYIKNSSTYFEREPMANLSKDEKLHAYKHTGFWQCMDTVRDKDYLDKIKCVNKRVLPWKDFII